MGKFIDKLLGGGVKAISEGIDNVFTFEVESAVIADPGIPAAGILWAPANVGKR